MALGAYGHHDCSDCEEEHRKIVRLSPLPTEILTLVLDPLARPDLARCLRVNSFFCSLSLPILHHSIRLSELGPWPLFDDRIIPGPLSRNRPKYLQRNALAHSATRVDVHPHKTSKCYASALRGWGQTLPPLPKLDVLRIFLRSKWSGARMFHTNVDPHMDRNDYAAETACAALKMLHPPTLVVRGLSLVHNLIPRGEVCAELQDSVRHLVAVFEPDNPYLLPRHPVAVAQRSGTIFRSRLPPNIQELTIIFHPPGRHVLWRTSKTPTLSWQLVHAYAAALYTQATLWLIQNPERTLEIVNVSALAAAADGELEPRPADATRYHSDVRHFLRASIVETLGTSPDLERVLGNLHVLTMEEYLADNGWEDVFDAADIAPWTTDVACA